MFSLSCSLENLIESYHIEPYQLILLLATLIALFNMKQLKGHMTAFLFGCILFELILGKIASICYDKNLIVYNAYIPYCTIFYFLYYYRGLKQYSGKKWLWALLIAYLLFSCLNLIWLQGFTELNNYSYVFGMTVVLIVMIVHLNKVAMIRESNLLLEQDFWLGTGIVLFYTASFPFLLFLDEILKQNRQFFGPLYKLVAVGNYFLCLGYLMVALCPILNKHFSKELFIQHSSSH